MTAPGAQVTVTSHGDGDTDLYVRRAAAPESGEYDCKSAGDTSDESCTIAGGGPIYVAVFAASASAVSVDVEYLAQDVADPTCLDGEMPRDAVLVKADWHRKLDRRELPLFTRRRRGCAAACAATRSGSPTASPIPSRRSIYTVTLPNGNVFRMPALHVMTKELDHWLWITLWWSPDPDTDFGADRPAAVAALPGPWRNYKMCVDRGVRRGRSRSARRLRGLARRRARSGARRCGTPTWCSNPYLELGAGNAATNCIGCHQHGGTALHAEAILATQPHYGTTRVRNNFFTDYPWAITGGRGEDLSAIVQAEVDYWDANDP